MVIEDLPAPIVLRPERVKWAFPSTYNARDGRSAWA
jgi:hypothetical protein